ncbi:hypothetical protein RHGRI_012461 [Rhododendron griersonianum]|uniref:Peroxidase n=1 Tax=Rhododendron griersonianum TaxID=479676 RepID=A0AAV6KR64_9ERIC|nr:hypothetical protein RHGRI_012461 [Rhododendron griersonianum]
MKCSTFMNLFNIVVIVVVLGIVGVCHGDGLCKNFYEKSCPLAEQIVQNITWTNVASSPFLPAQLLRLAFHDCIVRGCEASILLDSTANNTAEKAAPPNLSLGGFNVIDAIKTQLEINCPGIVSCADIVALATRDAVSFQYNESLWEVETGRRDGTVSLESEALAELPSPFANFANLKQAFAGKAFLRTKCKGPADTTTNVPMDPGNGPGFDNHYYTILKQNKGLFQSDAALLTDKSASDDVNEMSTVSNQEFFKYFGHSMKRLGAVGVLTGNSGEIRKICSAINS